MAPHILILGGGPAGLSTALHLAQFAIDLVPHILVLERAHYPRHKLCAGALTADGEVILQRLGLDVTQIPHVDASEAHFDFAGRGLLISTHRGHALRMIRRDEFDAWMASKVRLAGIEIREGVTVHRVEPRRDAVLVHTDAGILEAAVVVGADGSNGVTRRSILPKAPIHTARLLEALIPLPGTRGRGKGWGSAAHQANAAYFDFAPVPHGIAGYTWDFPTQVNGQPMRCWGIYDANLRLDRQRPALRQSLADEMRRHGADLASVELQGHPIRWFSPRSQLSVPRVILVGDAAGADGIFGEGISIALGYGRIAAEAIQEAIARGDYSFRDYRPRILRSPLGRALVIRAAITHILYRLHWAWFQRFFWGFLKPVVAGAAYIFVLNWARRMR